MVLCIFEKRSSYSLLDNFRRGSETMAVLAATNDVSTTSIRMCIGKRAGGRILPTCNWRRLPEPLFLSATAIRSLGKVGPKFDRDSSVSMHRYASSTSSSQKVYPLSLCCRPRYRERSALSGDGAEKGRDGPRRTEKDRKTCAYWRWACILFRRDLHRLRV